jgi:GNAT superfamily N-acetyltransferase
VPTAVRVRRAGPADAAVLADLHEPLHRLHAQAVPEDYPPYDPEAARTYYAGVLADPLRLFWVAESDGRPVGQVGCELVDRPATPFTRAVRMLYVHQLSVLEDARRAGVGRALMQVAEQEAARSGCHRLRLDHRPFNEGAHRFYEALGYRTHQVSMAKVVGEPRANG